VDLDAVIEREADRVEAVIQANLWAHRATGHWGGVAPGHGPHRRPRA